MSFRPVPAVERSTTIFVGTFRVTRDNTKSGDAIRASGDLYEITDCSQIEGRKVVCDKGFAKALGAGASVPMFPTNTYRYYLEVAKVEETGQGATLHLRAHKYDPYTQQIIPGTKCQVYLTRDASSNGQFPSGGGPEFYGELHGAHRKTGEFHFQYLGEKLRRAKVRLLTLKTAKDRAINVPGEGAGLKQAWQDAFSPAKWDLEVESVVVPPHQIAAPQTDYWAPYDLGVNAAKLRAAYNISPDAWVYDLMCVSRFENSAYLGMMFDSEATDLNGRPRESAAVAALQGFQTGGSGKSQKPQPFQEVDGGRLYLRTALHELGHCFNLTHTLTTSTVMDTTDHILARENPALNGSAKVKLSFARADIYWLQHAPDIVVRPGGVSRHKLQWRRRERSRITTVLIRSAPGLTLSVVPVDQVIPFGAPVRLNIELSNSGQPTFVPGDISLRGGWISGSVSGPDRVVRYFRSAFKCCNSLKPDGRLVELPSADRENITDSMTILRGIDTPLFPKPGVYQITLELRWDYRDETRQVTGETSVIVNPPDPTDPRQSQAAKFAINEPLLMPALVQGRLEGEAVTALDMALSSKTLAPHYAAIALRCYDRGTRSLAKPAEWEERIRSTIGQQVKGFGWQRAGNSLAIPTSKETVRKLGSVARMTWREKSQLKHLLKAAGNDPMIPPSRSTKPEKPTRK
jgi:hypothetical protein